MRRLGVTVAFVVFAWTGSANAAAGDDARLVYAETGFVNTGTIAAGPVACASGEAALGGGIRTLSGGSMWIQETGPQTASGATLATGERPGRWYSSVYNDSGASRNYSTYAVCSASSDVTVQTTTLGVSISPDGGRQGSATFPCPAGQRAVGGGILGAGRLEASGPVDESLSPASTIDGDIPRGWFVSMVTDSAMPPTYRIFVLCSATSAATIAIDTETLQPNEQASLGVGCAADRRLLSGGVIGAIPRGEIVSMGAAQGDGLAYLSQSANNTPTTGYGWRAALRNIGAAVEYKVAAVCEPSTPGPTPVDPTDPTDPTNPPSNAFTTGKLSRNRDRGTGVLPVTVPGPGTVAFESPKLKPQTVAAAAAGEIGVTVKAAQNGKRKLRRTGKLKASAAITFTPTGGAAATQDTRLKLVRD